MDAESLAAQHAPFLIEFERQLLDHHVCAVTHSKAIAFARGVKVPDMLIANMLAAAVLRSNDEVDAFDALERGEPQPTPYVLYRWDTNDDEGRGARHECGVYRTKAAADAEAERCNATLLDKINRYELTKYNNAMERWRAFKRDTMPIEPRPITDYVAWARKPAESNPYGADQPCRAWPWLDHYYTEPLEFAG